MVQAAILGAMGLVRSAAGEQQTRLVSALALSVAILVMELVAALAANSVALLADAGHVFADAGGMAISAIAIRMAARRPSTQRSFGLYRLEILAATLNAVVLLAIAASVIWEGIDRLGSPADVGTTLMIVVAAVALIANLIAVGLLRRGQAMSLTVRGAYLEAFGDAIGAGTVLIAGVLIAAFGFRGADGLAAILIGILILPRTWQLFRDSLDVLLEATPKGVDMDLVRQHILDSPGVSGVHDLHAWTITSGMNVVSAHVVLEPEADPGRLIDHLSDCLAGDFDIDHSTFQLETAEHELWERRGARAQH